MGAPQVSTPPPRASQGKTAPRCRATSPAQASSQQGEWVGADSLRRGLCICTVFWYEPSGSVSFGARRLRRTTWLPSPSPLPRERLYVGRLWQCVRSTYVGSTGRASDACNLATSRGGGRRGQARGLHNNCGEISPNCGSGLFSSEKQLGGVV